MKTDSSGEEEVRGTEGADVLRRARGIVYTFLAVAFTEPHTERFSLLWKPPLRHLCMESALLLEDHAIEKEWNEIGPAEGAPSHLPVQEVLDALPVSVDQACEEYGQIFGFTMAKDCPPHAVEYCANDNMFYRSQRLADIAGFYEAFGLRRTRNNREREDHIVYLAEFMAFMLAKEECVEGMEQKEGVVRHAVKTFFAEHCGWWWPAFACCIARKSPADSFYALLGRFLRHFCAWERHAFGISPFTECPEPKVPRFDPEGSCFSCIGEAKELGGKGI